MLAMRTVQVDLGVLGGQDVTSRLPSPTHLNVENIRRGFDTQLAGLLQVPDRDAAYTAVSKLPEHDPLRRTLATILRNLGGGGATRGDAKNLLHYLQSYKQADESLRGRMNVRSYDGPTIDLLIGVAEQLLALSEG